MMNFIPYRIKKRFTNYIIARYLRRVSVNFDTIPSLVGSWPEIVNEGVINFGKNCQFRSFRLNQRIRVFKNAKLTIGEASFVNDGVVICATQSVIIGQYAKIGDMTYIYDSDFHQVAPDVPVKQAPVHIGNNVWIGAHAKILAGAVIGDHSVVAAGSIVIGEFPAKSLIAGTPAKVIKTLNIPDSWIRR